MKIFAISIAATLLVSACGDRAQFQPTEHVTGVSPSGQPAASYDLRHDQTSRAQITVNVWSEGAARSDDRTYIDLAVELRNASDAPIELDRGALALATFNTAGAPLAAARLERLLAEKQSATVAAHSASMMRLRFELALPAAPSQLGALRFRWGIVREDGERYVQFTEFRAQAESTTYAGSYYDPIYDFYDPFFYGAPYGYHLNYYVPVRRVIIERRDRPRPRPHARR